jgi:uncharacterized protein YprB with RNaseH-like and TPR domain/predicted nuclease with RNAse H fold/dephospho-CoA kinase
MDLAASTEQSLLPFSDFRPASRGRTAIGKAFASGKKAPRIDPQVLAALHDHDRVLFLDVETTGLSRHYDDITLVGWLFDGVYRVLVAGDDSQQLLRALSIAAAIVTFNGTLFDLAFLRKTFPNIDLPKIHVDLRYLARRADLTGGQKAIERQLQISVRAGLEDVDGAHAVLLWHRYLRGDSHSLRRLIEYNRCDVIAMRQILDDVLDRLVIDPDLWQAQSRFSERPYVNSGWAASDAVLPDASRLNRPKSTFDSLFAGTAASNAIIVGIDLTGSEKRPSGWCILRGKVAETGMVATDNEMVERILALSPDLVSIDSPLSIPFGRSRVDDNDPSRSQFGIMRQCERELKRRGINVYPCLLPSMQGLTKRGTALAKRLREYGVPVIESYPGAAQDIMGIPRKGAGEEFLKQGLADFGVYGSFTTRPVRHDELDAVTSALVGSFFLAGKYEPLSGPAEDALIIPDLNANRGPIVVGISGRICAGKTTAARFLERQGFAYTRFSSAIDQEILDRGGKPDRESRQRIGLEINRTKGQRWLCERVLAPVRDQPFIVVDGIRFPEDRAFMIERFGSRFLHLHVQAPTEVRRARFAVDLMEGLSFDEVDAQPVEKEIDQTGRLAEQIIDNSATTDAIEDAVWAAVDAFVRKSDQTCLSRSS